MDRTSFIGDVAMQDIKKLLDKITVDNVIRQIENRLQSPFFIAEYIVGLEVWKSLSRDDQRILAAHVRRIMIDNKLLQHNDT